MKRAGLFLDVNLHGNKVFGDEARHFWIGVDLGIQPSACASSRSGAEIQQYGLVRGLRFSHCGVYVFSPFNCHRYLLSDAFDAPTPQKSHFFQVCTDVLS